MPEVSRIMELQEARKRARYVLHPKTGKIHLDRCCKWAKAIPMEPWTIPTEPRTIWWGRSWWDIINWYSDEGRLLELRYKFCYFCFGRGPNIEVGNRLRNRVGVEKIIRDLQGNR